MTEICMMLARQRSGTGALGSALDQWNEFSYVGEVFTADQLGEDSNYFTHLLKRVEEDPRNSLPSSHAGNFNYFTNELCRSSEAQHVIIDVKYNSTHHFNGFWHGPFAQPELLAYAKNSGWRIIHLLRRNHLAVYVSGRIAEINGVWHTDNVGAVSRREIEVDTTDLLRFLHLSSSEDNFFSKLLSGYDRLLAVEYSEMFDEYGALAGSLVSQISNLFNVKEVHGLKPLWVKQTPSAMRDVIVNFDEVRSALSATDFSWMIEV